MPVLIGGLDSLQARLVYPLDALQSGLDGRVIVSLIVSEEGRVSDAYVARAPQRNVRPRSTSCGKSCSFSSCAATWCSGASQIFAPRCL